MKTRRRIGTSGALTTAVNESTRLVPLTDHPSLQERTYQAMRKALLAGEFAMGERIFETDVAAMLGVSRVPVREAVRRLQQDGLLEVRPRSGNYVTSISPTEADDIYRIRAALEGTAAALAAERITERELLALKQLLHRQDEETRLEKTSSRARSSVSQSSVVTRADEFHRAVHMYARSPRLYELLELIYAQVMQFRNITLRMPGRAEAASHGHHALYDALSCHDAVEAERLMRAHVDSARHSLLSHLDEMTDAGSPIQSAVGAHAHG